MLLFELQLQAETPVELEKFSCLREDLTSCSLHRIRKAQNTLFNMKCDCPGKFLSLHKLTIDISFSLKLFIFRCIYIRVFSSFYVKLISFLLVPQLILVAELLNYYF